MKPSGLATRVPLARVSVWVAAARPRTLPAAVVPVLVGSACAASEGAFDPAVAVVALVVAVLLQVGTNFVNDWGDHRRGADGPGRTGPVRAVAAGWITPGRMAAAGVAAFAAAAILGVLLVLRGGLPVLGIGIASIAAGLAYTAGPFPLAYHGLGEAFVFAFFGPVAVCGTELVQLGRVTPLALAASLPVGMIAASILVVNNVRDVEGDRRAGKRTLAVRLGAGPARALYAALLGAAFASPPALFVTGLAGWPVLSALAAIPLAAAPLGAVFRPIDGPALNRALAATARLHLVFGALLGAGIAIGPALAGGWGAAR